MRRIDFTPMAVILLAFAAPVQAQAPAPAREEPATIESKTGMKLILVPAGRFLMGSPDTDTIAEADEKPQHEVRITRSFYLGITEVTQGQFQALMGQNPSFFRGSDSRPVERVTWNEAIEFCNKLSERDGLTPYYQSGKGSGPYANGYRLPSEAEWEYACRAGSKTRYGFGDEEEKLSESGWFKDNSANGTHAVGQKRPNAWGLFDMHGNVWEWCNDGYDANSYRNSPASDPPGSAQAAVRVNRGGAWSSPASRARSSFRRSGTVGARGFSQGFRVARASASG